MARVRRPSSVAARKTRMAISLRLATSSFLKGRPWPLGVAEAGSSDRREAVINSESYTWENGDWQRIAEDSSGRCERSADKRAKPRGILRGRVRAELRRDG